ncbi:MAG: DUF222 domain-containing protein [Acidimicrobiales bacterium]
MTSLGCLGTELDEGIALFSAGVVGGRTAAANRVEGLLGRAEACRRVLAGYEARLVALADELSADGGPGAAPEDVLGRGGVSSAEAHRRAARQRSVGDLPLVSGVVGSGRANPECLDRLAGARSRLEGPAEQAAFVGHDADLAEWVVTLPPRSFARRVNRLVDRIARDAGRTVADRRRSEVGLRFWLGADGLYRLNGVFDPESAEAIGAALNREMGALARSRVDEGGVGANGEVEDEGGSDGAGDGVGCRGAGDGVGSGGALGSEGGGDAVGAVDGGGGSGRRFDDRLRADALVEMLARAFRPGSEIASPLLNVIVDVATLTGGGHPGTVAEWGHTGHGVDPATLSRMQCGAWWQPIVYDRHRRSSMDVGRSKRVATARQRRALRALYSTCAFADCDRPFAWCHIHHVTPWNAGGPTDLANLVPLCTRHHHLVHEGRWTIELEPDRQLRIHRPDGRPWATTAPDGPVGQTPGRTRAATGSTRMAGAGTG